MQCLKLSCRSDIIIKLKHKLLTLCLAFSGAFFSTSPAFGHDLASWYGPGFDGKLTANGEIYNQNVMTCAHKLLTFGTVVIITNLNNGRKATCRINDRGPYVKGRVIDVSKAVAIKLDMIKSGVIPVEIEIK